LGGLRLLKRMKSVAFDGRHLCRSYFNYYTIDPAC
jgi:hypothetical protein